MTMSATTRTLSQFCAVLLLAGCATRNVFDGNLSPAHRIEEEKLVEKARQSQAPLLDELEAFDVHRSRITLYTIDPNSFHTDDQMKVIPQPAGVPSFHDWKVLGTREITGEQEKIKLLTALVRGGRETNGDIAMCFLPRHALRIAAPSRTVDIIVCFECREALVFGALNGDGFRTSESPARYFNKIAAKYGLPVAK